jgi:hypothetical protein
METECYNATVHIKVIAWGSLLGWKRKKEQSHLFIYEEEKR